MSHETSPSLEKIGSYHRAAMRAAQAIAARTPGTKIAIAARYGLITNLDEMIEPYELTTGQPGAIVPAQLRRQAADLGLARAEVTVLGGARYTKLARTVWSDATAPLAGDGGMGYQIQHLTRVAAGDAGALPDKVRGVRAMIPHDAQPIGAPRVAELLGITVGTLRTSGRKTKLPAQLNPGGRIGIWDERQIIADRDGTEMPKVITDDARLANKRRHPMDRLTDIEAAGAAGVAPATWRRWVTTEPERVGATSVEICGQRYWLRGSITRRHDAPPGFRSGRTVGARDLRPRKKPTS